MFINNTNQRIPVCCLFAQCLCQQVHDLCVFVGVIFSFLWLALETHMGLMVNSVLHLDVGVCAAEAAGTLCPA